jgi:hypothetical protein
MITGDDPSVGVYFVDVDGDSTKAPATAFLNNGDTEIDLIIPDLRPGIYRLKIITISSGGAKPLIKPRSCIYDVLFAVDPTPTP